MALGLVIVALGFFAFANVGVTAGESEYFSTFFLPVVLFGFGFRLVLRAADDGGDGVGARGQRWYRIGRQPYHVGRVGQVLVVGILGGLAINWFGQLLINDDYVKSLPAAAQPQLGCPCRRPGRDRYPRLANSRRAGARHQ